MTQASCNHPDIVELVEPNFLLLQTLCVSSSWERNKLEDVWMVEEVRGRALMARYKPRHSRKIIGQNAQAQVLRHPSPASTRKESII
jgi:hypothetical protein